jgi:MtN3 and saliva related transmembrane protein
MDFVTVVGFTAGVLTTFSAAPQLVYSFRTRDVASIDLKFQIMLLSGLFLWALYGVFIRSLPIILFNTIGMLLWLPVSFMKFKEKRQGA